MKIGMIGIGDIAKKAYLPVIASHKKLTPIICTRNSSTRDDICRQYRINESFEHEDELIHSRPDMISIHSATEAHFNTAKKCILAGIPTFIDKPISYHYSECETLVELAKAHNVPLMVGFNRRYVPLHQPFKQKSPINVHYQKNRFDLPATARVFIYDDFIHVLDFVLTLSQGKIENLKIHGFEHDQLLAHIFVQWEYEGALFTAEMNRLNGRNEEQLQFSSHNEKWVIHNLAEGQYYAKNTTQSLGFGDWDNTLVKRGFSAMIEDWIAQVEQHTPSNYEAILAPHRLCEQIIHHLKTRSKF